MKLMLVFFIATLNLCLAPDGMALENGLDAGLENVTEGVNQIRHQYPNFVWSRFNVVAFVSTQCPCSQSYEPVLQQMEKEFASKNFGILRVTLEESTQNREIAHTFGALRTPHVYLIEMSDSRPTLVYRGAIGTSHLSVKSKRNYLREALESALLGQIPDPRTTAPLGCLINE